MVVGGWQIEGILTVMTGTPFTVTYSSTYLNLNQGGTNTPDRGGSERQNSERNQHHLERRKPVV